MSKLKSKIDYKKAHGNAYDTALRGLSMMLMDEAGQMPSPELPKDFINFKKIGIIDKDGNVKTLRFAKPKNKLKMKLSKKQKEVILAMRNKVDVFRWLGTPSCKFNFMGKTFRYDMGTDLQKKKLIESRPNSGLMNTYYQLTELGKTVEL